MQRTAGSNSGIEIDFKGGVDQDSKEEPSEFQSEKMPPCGIYTIC